MNMIAHEAIMKEKKGIFLLITVDATQEKLIIFIFMKNLHAVITARNDVINGVVTNVWPRMWAHRKTSLSFKGRPLGGVLQRDILEQLF